MYVHCVFPSWPLHFYTSAYPVALCFWVVYPLCIHQYVHAHCWFGIQEEHPACKNEGVGVVICLE